MCKGKGYLETGNDICPQCKGVCYVGEPEPCGRCEGDDPQCARCGGTGLLKVGRHPAGVRAKEILAVKFAAKEIELYEKLLLAGKFHASFIVIGALSSRMAGADGLNAQGIKHTKEVRQMFPLTWGDNLLCGGDFSSFEVTIADAVCNDEALRAELIAGRKIHALFGMAIFPGTTYEEVKSSDGSTTNDMYTKGKQGFFGTMLYGGDHSTLVNRLGIERRGRQAGHRDLRQPVHGRQEVAEAGRRLVLLHDPAGRHRHESRLERPGRLRRDDAGLPPLLHSWRTASPARSSTWPATRRSIGRTARSRSSAATACRRPAVPSRRPSTARPSRCRRPTCGRRRTMKSSRPVPKSPSTSSGRFGTCSRSGVNDWHVAPMNIHDEIMCVTRPDMVSSVTEVVRDSVEHFRPYVPLIGMDWNEEMANWAEKKSGTIKIRAPEMMK